MTTNRARETGTDQQLAALKQIEARLDEICTWLRFQNRSTLQALLKEALRSKRERLIYELTDGTKSATEIARTIGISQPRVSQVWNQWKELGIIMESVGAGARYTHICSLSQVGLDTEPSEDKT